ncbi:hypothetical protein GCM10027290_45940 [Micromonospora sonneratiae]
MSHIEKITGELRTLMTGVERAHGLTTVTDHKAQEVARRAADAGFTAVAMGMTQVREAIILLQNGLGSLAVSISEATKATAVVPNGASPQDAATGLSLVQGAVDSVRNAAASAIAQADEVRRIVVAVLQGGQPGPLLQTLANVREMLTLVAQRTARQSVETAVAEAHRLGILGNSIAAGGSPPTSANTSDQASTTARSTDPVSNGHGTLVPWSRRPTGVPGGSPTGPRTKISPKDGPVQQRSLELENECADTVADKGYRVHQNPTKQQVAEARLNTGDTGDPASSPDYLIEDYVFDCYSPTPGKSTRGIWSQVSAKMEKRQAQRITLNLHDWDGELSALQKQFADWPIPDLKEMLAVTRSGAIIQVVRRDQG